MHVHVYIENGHEVNNVVQKLKLYCSQLCLCRHLCLSVSLCLSLFLCSSIQSRFLPWWRKVQKCQKCHNSNKTHTPTWVSTHSLYTELYVYLSQILSLSSANKYWIGPLVSFLVFFSFYLITLTWIIIVDYFLWVYLLILYLSIYIYLSINQSIYLSMNLSISTYQSYIIHVYTCILSSYHLLINLK